MFGFKFRKTVDENNKNDRERMIALLIASFLGIFVPFAVVNFFFVMALLGGLGYSAYYLFNEYIEKDQPIDITPEKVNKGITRTDYSALHGGNDIEALMTELEAVSKPAPRVRRR